MLEEKVREIPLVLGRVGGIVQAKVELSQAGIPIGDVACQQQPAEECCWLLWRCQCSVLVVFEAVVEDLALSKAWRGAAPSYRAR